MLRYKLKKDLPGCPKGRIFKQDIKGNFFHSMTDDEGIKGDFKSYHFTNEEVIKNKDWFELFEEEPISVKDKIQRFIKEIDKLCYQHNMSIFPVNDISMEVISTNYQNEKVRVLYFDGDGNE